MSEASRRSRVTITLGRSDQVVNRDESETDDDYELPRVGTKRSVKERLGNQLSSSIYGSEDEVSKRQRGEASFSGNDLQISQNDLRLKLMQKNAERQAQSNEGSTMDLRKKLSRSEQPARSSDTRPRMAEQRDAPLPSSRTARGSSQMISSGSFYSPRVLEDLRHRSPERFVDTSRALSPPGNARRFIPRAVSPPKVNERMLGTPRDLPPPGNNRRIISTPRGLSPPRNEGRMMGVPRDRSPPGNTGRRIGTPRDLSPTRSSRSFIIGSRALSPTRNMGSYMGSPRRFSSPSNPVSYIVSSRGSPTRSRILDDVTVPRYTFRGVVNDQGPASDSRFSRPMLLPPAPNPRPLPSSGQLPPHGSMMWNHPFSVVQQVGEPLQTVDSFLESIGLGRYHLAFKKEEVDMNTIKQMKESDLKDLNIPMGPRKRILQAIASLPQQ